jgi:hypothetical protein
MIIMGNQPSDSTNVKGGTGITAGGAVSMGDVTGLQAIGSYINQIQLTAEKLSAEELIKLMEHLNQKREESANKEILDSYSPSALPDYPPRLKGFVIENRLDDLNCALIYLHDHRILLVSGVGGVGKTTLARALIETRPANVPLPFWFDCSMNMDVTLGSVIEKLASYMNAPYIADFKTEGREVRQDDIDRLTDELQKREPVWLVFDNLETILDDRHFHDPMMDSLFTSLRNSTHQAKIIVTSRTLPILKDGESLIDTVEDEKQELTGLEIEFAIDYLIKNGLGEIEYKKVEELAGSVDGHPLALKLLVGVVKKFGASDTLNDISRYQRRKEDVIKKTKRLFDKLAGDEKELLERVSVFRRPIPMTAVEVMFTDETSEDAVDELIDKSLLETDHGGKYWLHPLVREFSYDDLKDKTEAHKLSYEYYSSLPIDPKNFVETSHHLIKYNEIINDSVIQYFINLPNDTYIYFIINEILKKNTIGNAHKIFNLFDKVIALKNIQIIISFILSYGYYFEDVYAIDEKASFEVYHKILESYTDVKVFEAVSNSVSSIANLHPRESLQIWKKITHIDEQLADTVVFYISSSNLKSNEYLDFLSGILCQNDNVSISTKRVIITAFQDSKIMEKHNILMKKYYISIKECLNDIQNLSINESINYIERNYKMINPPFVLEMLSEFIKYDKARIYELIWHVSEYSAKTHRMMIFQVSEILYESMEQEDLDYINLFTKIENDKYELLMGIQTLDLLSGKFESELLIKYLNPILKHEDITIKTIANITKKIIDKKHVGHVKQKKLDTYFRLLRTCMNPMNLIPMIKTELFKTTPFVLAVSMWGLKKTIENYDIYELYDVGKNALKINPVMLDASLCIMTKIQTNPKKYIDLVYKYGYKNKERQVKFGSIPQFIFMGDREPETVDKYLKDIMMDGDDEVVLFLLECLSLYKNQDHSNREEMLSYLINHKNPDISGFSDFLLNGI